MPQPPQLALSFCRSAQPWPAQHTVPPSQPEPLLHRQAEPEQAWLAPQLMPQPPQLAASPSSRTQPEPGQHVSLPLHTRTPSQRWSVRVTSMLAPLPNAAERRLVVAKVSLTPAARALTDSFGAGPVTGGNNVNTNVLANS